VGYGAVARARDGGGACGGEGAPLRLLCKVEGEVSEAEASAGGVEVTEATLA
jgi:hypothetical protein